MNGRGLAVRARDGIRASRGALLICLFVGQAAVALGRDPYILLGPQQAFPDQPYVTVEVFAEDPAHPGQYTSLGPDGAGGLFGTAYNYFLLDTGANAILAVDAAATNLEDNGLDTEADFVEIGVAGTTIYSVSAPYRIGFAGTDEVMHYLPNSTDHVRILSSPSANLGGEVDYGGIPGLIGMPAMVNRVTTLDFSHWSEIENILDFTPMGVAFSDNLPAGQGHRYSVAVDNRIAFSPADGRPEWESPDSALPTYADIPFLTMTAANHDPQGHAVDRSGTFLLDTGAQFTVLSRSMAFRLGMDTDGDGDLLDDAPYTVEIGGIGGTREVPVMYIDAFRLPTQEGVDLVWSPLDPTNPEELGIEVLVLDVLPCADVNGDGIVDAADSAVVQANWGQSVVAGDLPSGDVTGDGLVNQDDLDLIQEQLGQNVFLDGVLGVDLLTAGIQINIEDLSIEGDPYFQKIHFDFRDMDEGSGTVYLDLSAVYDVVQYPSTPGDANNDGFVDDEDAAILAAHWLGSATEGALEGDFNGDFVVDDLDLAILSANWQPGGSGAAVPEPGTMALLIAGLACVLLCRRPAAE